MVASILDWLRATADRPTNIDSDGWLDPPTPPTTGMRQCRQHPSGLECGLIVADPLIKPDERRAGFPATTAVS